MIEPCRGAARRWSDAVRVVILDSRAHVTDQRSGTVPVNTVIGKARVIVLPPARWQGIADPDPQQAKTQALGAAVPSWPSGLPLGAGLLLSWPIRRGSRLLWGRLVAGFTPE